MRITPPRYIVWSADSVDLSDPFRRKWCTRQVLLHGRAQDIRRRYPDVIASKVEYA